MIILLRLLRNSNSNHSELKSQGFFVSLKKALGSLQNWLPGLYACLLNLPILLLGGLWGLSYLQTAHQLSAAQASNATALIFLGSIVGCPLMGLWSDRLGLRRWPMLLGGCASLLCVLPLLYGDHLSYTLVLLLSALLGFVTSTQVIAYPLVAESNDHAITSTALSLTSMILMLGSAFSQNITGWLLDWHWLGTLQDGAPLYRPADYRFALGLIPVGFLIAWVAALKIRETYGHRAVKESRRAMSTLDHDPTETREWLDALDALVRHEGYDRARFLLQQLVDHSVSEG